jgi:hypothetical protein
MSALSKHVIHQPRPLRRLAISLVALIVAMILVWLYVEYKTEQLQQQVNTLSRQNKQLINSQNEFALSSQHLSEQLFEQRHHLAIQNELDQELKQQISSLQNEVVDLNRELAFYHNITQGNANTELHVRELELIQDKLNKQQVHYRLVLSQGKKITKPISGKLSLQLVSANKEFDLPIIEHTFKLRHVQVLTGSITLTDTMQPDAVTVKYKQDNNKSRTQRFDWQLNAS